MLLETINGPQDLKRLTLEQLTQLAGEIRQRMVEVVSATGGHLASSLGTVELCIALHYCLNTPQDKIVWDVGHQAYAHKLLTGRNKGFATLRQFGGTSGFPCKEESEYDPFSVGHSSTAVSLALGLASARDCSTPKQNFKVVAVIGDGSLSGGVCFEGLNNTGHLKKDILVVLNTNEMSISPNVGALSTYLNKLISLPVYNRFKTSLEALISVRLPKGSRIIKIANKFEESLKGLFIPGMLFEELGFRYFGPLDGHNLGLLIPRIKNILTIRGPLLLHVVTQKGKGFKHAEDNPVKFHGIGPFDIATGESVKKPGAHNTYTNTFSEKITALARLHPEVVTITAAMPEGTGLDKFRDAFPERFFDVGIAEAHAVCFAAGLAREGLKPVVAVYSTFLQRAYDQLIEDVALQNLGVIFAVDRAGIVGEDGQTHQGIFDIAYFRSIPNFVLMAPKDGKEFEAMLEFCLTLDAPAALRYPRACLPAQSLPCSPLMRGKAEVLRQGGDVAIFALGSMVYPALEAAEILSRQGLESFVANSRFIKPLDQELFSRAAAKARLVVTVEEGVIEGGFGSAVTEALNRPVLRLGIPSAFVPHGKREILLEKFGLTAQGIAARIKDAYGKDQDR
ncbi:MAG: 1-deoxy-D-xylulose-5-phosphate synthase [Candidatus Omnitrophica bacterium]|nr:1-deoxy-D-xylulose-5-phosphate synthase [Candidatus Omnitrophota bacterium]